MVDSQPRVRARRNAGVRGSRRAAVRRGSPEPHMTPRRSVLVVDDEQTLRETLAETLTQDGLRVVTAANGREALERFRADPPDLILLDLMLPELSGIEVCRIIRRESAVPILMLT